MPRRRLSRCLLLLVAGAAAVTLYATPAALAAPTVVNVPASSDTPVDTGITLAAGEQARVTGVNDDAWCGWEPDLPCTSNDADGYAAGCVAFDLDCVAPGLPAWALIGRLDTRQWRLAGNGPTYFTGPGRLYLQFNDDEFGDNPGSLTATIDVLPPSQIAVSSVTSSPSTVGPGAPRIDLEDLPADVPLGDSTPETLAGTPLRSSPLRSSPLRSSPLRSSPLRSSPLRSSPLRSSELGPISLASVPLRSSSWAQLLAGTPLDAPPATVTLDQVFALDPLPAGIAALTLADVDLARTPLRSSSLGQVLLGNVLLAKLKAPGESNWCEWWLYQDVGCDLGTRTLMSIWMSGDDLARLELGGPGIDISGSPLATIALSDVEISATPLAGRSDLDQYPTVGALAAALPLPGLPALTLGDLLPGLVAPAELPFEESPLATLLDAAEPRVADRITTTATVQVPCTAFQLDLELRLPAGAHFVAGSARARRGAGAFQPLADPVTPTAPAMTLALSSVLGNSCSSGQTAYPLVVTFAMDPPARLGATTVEVAALGYGGDRGSLAGTDTRVEDTDDPGDTPATAQVISPGTLRTGFIADSADVDTYKLAAPAAGSTVTVVLSHLPADFDLTVTGPQPIVSAAPLRSSPLRSSPLRSSVIPDDLFGGAADTVTPALLQDLPLRSSDVTATPLRSSSINRGLTTETATFTVTADDAGKDFFLRVSGYNGARSDDPYVLRTVVKTPPVAPQCRARRTLPAASKGTFPTLPLASATKTLFLVNEQRLAQLYPSADLAALRTQLATIAARPEVGGAVIPVESDPQQPTDAAYAAWDADPCSASAANGVARAIRAVVGHVSANLDGLRSVVLIGGDELLPQARVLDQTSVANESEEAGALVFGDRDTAVSRSLRDGYLLTDDLYGDFDPEATTSGQVYVPDVALGRLVETPAEIGAQLDQYATANGALSVSTAHVAGYDFLTDAAERILGSLQTIPGVQATSRIDETWTAADAVAALNRAGGGISSVNGHFDHYRGMPASAYSGLVPNLFSATQVSPAASSLLFTAGCHAGLSVADVGATGTTAGDATRLLDWPQQVARSRAVYVANTTYGYGDTEAVAYTERLLDLLAEQVAGQKVTAGQALMIAKQRYAAEQQTPGAYDVKSSMGLTYYGLPFFRVGPTGQEGAAALPTAPSGSGAVSSAPFDVAPVLEEHEVGPDPWSTSHYWTADGQAPQVTHHRPIQPRTTLDVTAADGVPVHGAVIEQLQQTSRSWVNPVISQPVVDLGATAPGTPEFRGVFPTGLVRTSRTASANGLRDQLVLMAGQFDGATQRQRLFAKIAGSVLRSTSSDYEPPTMTDVRAIVDAGTASFSVRALSDDVVRAVVLAQVGGAETWQKVELTRSGDLWTGTLPVSGNGRDVTFFVQLVDRAGNVGVSANKGPGFRPSLYPGATAPELVTSPRRPASGVFSTPPTVSISAPGRPGVTFDVSIDGAAPARYTGPFTVSGNGRHTVRIVGSDGSTAGTVIDIASGAPIVTPTVSPAPSPEGFIAGPATISWSCSAAAGIATCPPAQTVSTEVAGQRFTSGVATDRLGTTATGTTAPLSVDLKSPTGTIDPYTLKSIILALLGKTKTISGTAADSLAGVRKVQVTYAPLLQPTKTTTVDATVSCADAARKSCTWTAAVPLIGSLRATAVVTDRAGRTTTVTRTELLVVS